MIVSEMGIRIARFLKLGILAEGAPSVHTLHRLRFGKQCGHRRRCISSTRAFDNSRVVGTDCRDEFGEMEK